MKGNEWALVAIAAIAVLDTIYVRHATLRLAQAAAARGDAGEISIGEQGLLGDAGRFLGRCRPRKG